MARRVLMAALGMAAVCGPAAAQDFAPPQGCEGVLTVQHKGCMLTNVWRCAGEPEGTQWVALFDDWGPFQVKQVDAEFQWLTTYFMDPARTERLETPVPDPESLTELFAEGEDSYDFTVVPGNGQVPQRYLGFDRISGETEIDGEPLNTTEFGYDVLGPEGDTLYRVEGRQYVSARHRIFLLGESWDVAAPDEVSDHSPVEFIYPGDGGFFSSQPKYGCGMLMSGLSGQGIFGEDDS